MVLAFSFMQSRVSEPVTAVMFLLYAVLSGLTFSVIFLVYELGSIGTAFIIAPGTFGALSIYGTVTRRT